MTVATHSQRRPGPPARAAAVAEASGRLFGRGLLYVVVWSFGLLAGVLITPVITRVLGVTGFGHLAAAVAVGQVLVVLVGLGMQAAIIRQYVDDDGDRRARGLLFASFAFALVLAGAAAASGPLWSPSLGFGSFGGALELVVLWVFPAAGCQAAMGLLRAQDRLGPFCAVSALQAVGGQACGVALLFGWQRSPATYALGLLVGQTIAFAVAITVTRPLPAGIVDGTTIQAGLALGLPLVPQGVAVFVLNAGDRLVIQRLLGADAVGRYQVAYSVGSLVLILMASLNQSWEAGVLGIADEAMRADVIAHARDRLVRMIQPLVIGLAVGAPLALRAFAPAAFHPHGLLVVATVVALSAAPYAFYLSNVLRLLSVRRTGPLAVASVVCAAVNIGLNFALIPLLGLTGSALATALALALQAALTQRGARRALAVHAPQAVTWSWATMGAAIALLTVLVPDSGPWLALRVIGAAACAVWSVGLVRHKNVPTP